MTYAITMVKCQGGYREDVLDFLIELKGQKDSLYRNVEFKECFISFGWPDFVLLLCGTNVELLKSAILKIRELIKEKKLGHLETSTIICATQEEIEKAKDKVKASIPEKESLLPD